MGEKECDKLFVVCKYQRPLSCVGKENYFAGNIGQNKPVSERTARLKNEILLF